MPLARCSRLLALGLVLSAAPALADPEGLPESPKLRRADAVAAELRQHGAARVIVEFAEPEPYAEDSATKERRSGALRRAQDAIVALARGSVLASADADDVTCMAVEPMVALETSRAGLARLLADPRVRAVHADTIDGPLAESSMVAIGMPQVWAVGGLGQGQMVAIIDSGVDASHPFLNPRVIGEACFTSRIRAGRGLFFQPTCPGGATQAVGLGAAAPCSAPGCLHGTHVAGIAAGSNPDPAGYPRSGVAPQASILAVNVFSQLGSQIGSAASDQIRALEWVYLNRSAFPGQSLAAVNMSLGGQPYTGERCDGDARRPMIDRLRAAGVATVIAAGNEGERYELAAPACISRAVTVGATNNAGRIAKFTNMSSFVDLMAPGVGIPSSVPGGYAALSGTSMAAPHVAGAFAALRSLYPAAPLPGLVKRLVREGKPVPDLRKEGFWEKPFIRVGRVVAGSAGDAAREAVRGKRRSMSVRRVERQAGAAIE